MNAPLLPPEVPLGEVADFINGYAFKPEDWSIEGLPIVRIQNLTGFGTEFNRTQLEVPRKYRINRGDLLVSWSASLGVFRWQGPEAVVNQHIFKVVPNLKKIDLDYLRHAIDASIHEMERFTHGSTMKHINRKEFLDHRIPLPSLNEQRRIAAILDKADALSRKRQESIEYLRELRSALYLSTFGDPVQNERKWTAVTLGGALDAGYIREVQDGNHGERHPKVTDFVATGIPFITANCLRDGRLNIENAYKLDAVWLSKLRVGFAQPGDLLLSHKGTVGEVAIVPPNVGPVILSPQVTYYRLGPELDARFLLGSFESKSFQTLLGFAAEQSTRAYIGITRQRELSTILPPLALQKEFSKVAGWVDNSIARYRSHLVQLEELFSSLQHRAFSGQL
ncbi:restriction endonuclease subunit S [Bradyrhizobium diazoefficiens]|uniref:restriction endonuclease subunit S n=1 Tax=Bradyrhizobium diazoefficiens TaxID=1355477 RepID=UPI0019092AE9|nr:restriction endonuclease subunit S [Bradyrhizobium diazoefficiens]QQO15153.1 restriction endonuclease subunit S [Bradyrhizobium diazoefficiens]